jgi:hypothetical protein
MPKLSLDVPIESLESIKALQSGHPVYLLVAEDQSHLVIKMEKTRDAENLRRNQLAMQIASPASRSVILSANELDTLKNFVRFWKMQVKHGVSDALPDDVKALAKDLAAGGTWFKMREARGLTNLASIARQTLEGDKSGARALAKALNASGGLEALGRIVGADLFNQNGDRFVFGYATKTAITTENGEVLFDCQALINVGNVMAAISDGKLRTIGLDSWDPGSEGSSETDMNKAVTAANWFGALLAPSRKSDRVTYGEAIASDLNQLLGPRNRRFSFLQQTRLDSDAGKRIADGMESIRKRLIERLEASLKRPNPAQGLQSRLDILKRG